MSGVKLDVLWSPIHHDKFIIWGPDITLYEVSRIKEIEKKTTCMYFITIDRYETFAAFATC